MERQYRGIAQLVEYWSPKPRVVGSSPSAPAMFNGRFRSDREKKRKAEISRDFSAFFAPNFFRISIDPFSIFLRVEGFEPANPKYCPTEDKEKATANRGIFFRVKLPDKLEFNE